MMHTEVVMCPEREPPLVGYLPRQMITVTVEEPSGAAEE